MANIKQVNVIERIQQLFRQGISQRRIALELDVSRNAVARYAGKTPVPPAGDGSARNQAPPPGASPVPNDQTEPHETLVAAQFETPALVCLMRPGAKWLSLQIAIMSCLVNDGRQNEPHATHEPAHFDKERRYVARRLAIGTDT